jgi:uncharacterized small protein (DUF1192 family)
MWSTDDVASWLEDWDLEDYIHTFREEKICGKALSLLEKEDLEYLGVIKLGDRIRIYRDIQQRLKACAASQSDDSAAENRPL